MLLLLRVFQANDEMLLNISRDDAEKRVWDLGLRAFTMLGNVSIVCGK